MRSFAVSWLVLLGACTTEVVLNPCEGELDLEFLQPLPSATIVEGFDVEVEGAIALTCGLDILEEAQKVISSDVDGVLEGESTFAAGIYSLATGPLSVGPHTLTFTVATDAANGTATVDVNVVENVAPTVSISSPAGDAPIDGLVRVEAMVADPQEPLESLTVAWTLDGLPVPNSPTAADPQGAVVFDADVAEGCHTLVVTVTDMLGQQGRDEVPLLVFDKATDTTAYEWLTDADGDGWGDPETLTYACTKPEGAVPVTEQTDCNDADADVRPGVPDYCQDGIDSDCSPLTPANCSPNGDLSTTAAGAYTDASDAAVGGDLNNDGIDDLVLSQEDEAVFYWGPGLGTLTEDEVVLGADLGLDNKDKDGVFGQAMAVLDDMTGDGVADLVAGVPNKGFQCGQSTQSPQYFGEVALLAGDGITSGRVDGFNVNAGSQAGTYPMKGFGPIQPGEALSLGVPMGETDVNAGCGNVIDTLGSAVTKVGDIDGDGLSEFAVGSNRYRNTANGVVFLILSTDLAASTAEAVEDFRDLARLTLTGLNGEQLGTAISSADVDGDGKGDLLVGSRSVNEGRVYVVLGRDVPASSAEVAVTALATLTFHGMDGTDGLGAGIAGLWDMDGDGDDEFALSAPGADGGAGVVYIVPGFYEVNAEYDIEDTFNPLVTPNATSAVRLVGDNEDALTAVVQAGDVNADGTPDLLVGAPGNSAIGSLGAAYLVYAGQGFLGDLWDTQGTAIPEVSLPMVSQTTGGARFYAPTSNQTFGEVVSGGFDFNNDGYGDILVAGSVGTYIWWGGGT